MADLEELRKRMEALNRAPLPEAEVARLRRRMQQRAKDEGGRMKDESPSASSFLLPPSSSSAPPIVYPRDVPRQAPRRRAALPVPSRMMTLQEAVLGQEVEAPGAGGAGGAGGKAFLVSTTVQELDRHGQHLHEAWHRLILRGDLRCWPSLSRHFDPEAISPDQILFVDLETTGLSGTPLFLIGTLGWDSARGTLIVKQYLARNYAEESAVISLYLALFARKQLLVSFNGKSFDVPYLRTRSIANALPLPTPLPNLDLLHECRRAYRGRFPNCKLQTLERHICGRTRTGDIPGHLIPDAYHAFVHSGNASHLASIIEHNRLDLVTLADLMVRMPGEE